MRRFLIAARVDGQLEALAGLHTLVQKRRPDGVLYAGSILGGGPTTHAAKLKLWEDFLDGLGSLGVFAALVPGATEVPVREFLRLAKDAEIDYPRLRVAHATLFEEPHVAVSGVGGELTEAEDRTDDRLCCARATAEYFLRMLWRSEQPYKVLLASVVPPGPLGGEEGNRVCGDFIDSYHPTLCVAAGTTERRGVQQIGHTCVVNPGRLADGCVAWLDWNRHKDEQVEMLRV